MATLCITLINTILLQLEVNNLSRLQQEQQIMV